MFKINEVFLKEKFRNRNNLNIISFLDEQMYNFPLILENYFFVFNKEEKLCNIFFL